MISNNPIKNIFVYFEYICAMIKENGGGVYVFKINGAPQFQMFF